MKKIFALILMVGAFSCAQKEEVIDYTKMSDEERLKAATEIAQSIIMVDGHVDLPYRMKVGGFTLQREILDVSVRTPDGNFDFPRAKEGGLDAPFMSIYIPAGNQKTPGASKALADSLIRMTERLASTFPDKFAMAYSPADIEANFSKGLISLPMGMENGAGIEDDLANVAYFFQRGIRYITLTHGTDNLIGDASYDTTGTHGGLSPFGEEVVKEMNRVGIMVDLSHVSDNTFRDALAITKVPVIASHSSVRKFTPGFERNMSDELIQAMAKNGGVMMINFGGSFIDSAYAAGSAKVREHLVNYLAENNLSRTDSAFKAYAEAYAAANNPFPTVQRVADHFDHVKNLVGVDYIGLGSDFDGVGDSLPTGLKDVSMFPNLIAELLKRGYTKEDIEKICYKNIFRVWKAVEDYAANQ
ncbi:membrane dipeptidase [Algoriphagus alkaliphilus]|uniref:Membrane dipeptidase n=1 Tax=Algoriphagus alkaliphilus TaxID=279824 RepID=A0A1G5UYD6_9BACT|nr:dipeptidase [Algoriphagus alkaliphilus]MBA4300773.1 membrane dipeptidase [Cyclobacterium sp.]SDA38027.1 membrane dipeptidase [Algoriphagus alkaliphilus]